MNCGDAGCSTEDYRYGMVEDGAQAGTGEPHSSTQLTDGQINNADLKLAKFDLVVTERIKLVSNFHKGHCLW